MVYLSSVVSQGEGSARGKPGAIVIAKKGGMEWSSKSVILKSAPYTIWHPHDRQAAMRYLFGITGSYTKGYRGKAALPMDGHKIPRGTTVPKPTAMVQAFLKGQVERYLDNIPKKTGKTSHSVHGIGMLATILQSKGYSLPAVTKEAVEAKAREFHII
jgi:hypothetical protein